MMMPFPPWEPDKAALNVGSLTEIQNVLPVSNGYDPVPSLAQVTSAVPQGVISGFVARSLLTRQYHYFAGSASKLYRWDQAATLWQDISKPATTYQALDNERWQFVQYGNFVIAVNAGDKPQVFDLGLSTAFGDLGGDPPQARFAAVWGDFLVLGGLASDASRIQWSGLDNITFWTPGQQNSDFQIFPDGGEVKGLTSSNNPLVFQETAIRRGVFMPGSREVFRFDKLSEERGIKHSYSLAYRGGLTFFANEEGFHQFDYSGGYAAIGYEKVNKTFLADLDATDGAGVIGAVDPVNPRVHWSYKSKETGKRKMIVFDWALSKWSCVLVEVKWVMSAVSLATTLESLDAISGSIDDLPFSLDAPHLRGGFPFLAAFDDDDSMKFFTGENMEAIITTVDAGGTSGEMQRIISINPIVERPFGTEFYLSLGRKRSQWDEPQWTEERTTSARTGVSRINSRGRYHRVKMRMPQGALWNRAQGVDAVAVGSGKV